MLEFSLLTPFQKDSPKTFSRLFARTCSLRPYQWSVGMLRLIADGHENSKKFECLLLCVNATLFWHAIMYVLNSTNSKGQFFSHTRQKTLCNILTDHVLVNIDESNDCRTFRTVFTQSLGYWIDNKRLDSNLTVEGLLLVQIMLRMCYGCCEHYF